MKKLLFLTICCLLFACKPGKDIRSAEEAVANLTVAEDLEVGLFASEPLLTNPTNIDIDDKGRVWVCEGYNYRINLNPDNDVKEKGDRIVILEDTDGDGKADKRKIFYQGQDINSALGIAVFGDKVYVSRSPHVFVFTDADGDDVPEKKEVLFSGLGGLEHDHGIHAFVFGPDGKLYFNHGDQGKQLLDANGKQLTDRFGRDINNKGNPYRKGMIFSMNRDASGLQVIAHNFRNNYEVTLDSYGSLWQSDNDDDGNKSVRINYIMEYGNYGYTDEMTGAGWRTKRIGMHEEIPMRHWHQNDPGVVPNMLMTGAGSPTGILVYEGDALPDRFHGQLIHCDAGPNVVRAYSIEKENAGYKADILPILGSGEDKWFRPADVCIAPDGSLFVADWYDPGVGGHRAGDQERGRIFRVAKPGNAYKVSSPDYSNPEGAITALRSPNQATRFKAWMSLHNMREEAVPALRKMAGDDNSRMRARALWLMVQLPRHTDATIQSAFADPSPEVRMAGIRMVRQFDPDHLLHYIETLVEDPAIEVRREAIIALHETAPSNRAANVWAEYASQYDGQDRWYLEALGIGAARNWENCFKAWERQNQVEWNTQKGRDIIWRARAEKALTYLGELAGEADPEKASDQRYFRAFDFHQSPTKDNILARLVRENNELAPILIDHFSGDFVMNNPQGKSLFQSLLPSIKGTDRYFELVNKLKLRDQKNNLLELVFAEPNQSPGVKSLRTLFSLGFGKEIEEMLLNGDQTEQSALFTSMRLLANDHVAELLHGIVINDQLPEEFRADAAYAMARGWEGENRMSDLLQNGNLPESVRTKAATSLLGSNRPAYREMAAKILDRPQQDAADFSFSKVMSMEGKANKGKSVFQTHCATCHQVNGKGTQFGPDLSLIGDKLAKAALLGSIVEPSAGISFGYEGYILTMKDGNVVQGYIESETGDKLTLRSTGGIAMDYATNEVASRKPLDASLMTANLHLSMTQQELADLLAYLEGLKEKKKAVAMLGD